MAIGPRRLVAPIAFLVCLITVAAGAQTHTEGLVEVGRGALEEAGRGVPRLIVDRELVAPVGGFTKVVWSSDGQKLAAYVSGGTSYSDAGNLITVWTAGGQSYREIKGEPGWPFTARSPLAFAGSDTQLVTPPPLGKNDLVLSVYDIDTGTIVNTIAGPSVAPLARHGRLSFAVSPDQALLAAALGGPNPVTLYSATSWEAIAALPEPPPPLSTELVVFSPDGRILATNQPVRRLLLYDVAKRSVAITITAFSECCDFIDAIAFGPDNQVAVSTATLPGRARAPNGEMLDVVVREPVRVFRIRDGERIASFGEPIFRLRHLAWGPARVPIAFSTGEDTIRLWDPAHPDDSGRAYKLRATVFSLAFSPDGSRLAIANGRYITICRIEP